MNKIKVSENFYLSEFESPDTKEVMIDEDALEKLQSFRNVVKQPVTLNSAYRTPERNKEVDGSEDSYHMKGRAFDIARIPGLTIDEMAILARREGFNGIGLYENFLHVDNRDYLWTRDFRVT
jgi:uncharacterized protein YcbK (DUF882 family)